MFFSFCFLDDNDKLFQAHDFQFIGIVVRGRFIIVFPFVFCDFFYNFDGGFMLWESIDFLRSSVLFDFVDIISIDVLVKIN